MAGCFSVILISMKYPIVQVETKGDLWLHGLLLEAENPNAIFINIHGTASNFYEEDFIEAIAEKIIPRGISMLSTNNRGAGVFDAWDGKGAATEMFEDCLSDIDAWIEFALEKEYNRI